MAINIPNFSTPAIRINEQISKENPFATAIEGMQKGLDIKKAYDDLEERKSIRQQRLREEERKQRDEERQIKKAELQADIDKLDALDKIAKMRQGQKGEEYQMQGPTPEGGALSGGTGQQKPLAPIDVNLPALGVQTQIQPQNAQEILQAGLQKKAKENELAVALAKAEAEAKLPAQLELEKVRGVNAARERAAVTAENNRLAANLKKEQQGTMLDNATAEISSGVPLDKITLPPGMRQIAAQSARKQGVRIYDTEGTKQKASDYDDLRAKAVRLEQLLQKPNVIAAFGPSAGRARSAYEAVGGQLDPDVQEARALSLDLSDTELRRRSGAATQEREYGRITKFATDPNRLASVNLANTRRMVESIDERLGTMTGVKPEKPRWQRKPGDTRQFNGKTQTWNGSAWVE